jgi:thymidylate kinase
VVCVHYLLAAYAHQNENKMVSLTWLQQINQFCRWPDLMIFIDTPIESRLRRLVEQDGFDTGALERERTELAKALDHYRRAIEHCRANGEEVAVVDGNQPAAAIQRACRELVDRL